MQSKTSNSLKSQKNVMQFLKRSKKILFLSFNVGNDCLKRLLHTNGRLCRFAMLVNGRQTSNICTSYKRNAFNP